MLGNWATGRLNMLIAPTITMTMEMTMATMGRLIKNFDMVLPSLTFDGKRLGVHLHAWTYLLYALGNHAFASFQSVQDNPLGADPVAHLNRPDAHFVLVVQCRDLIAALQLRHSALRDKERVFLHALSCPNFAVAAGAQNISRIRKKPGDPNCARTLIHLAVCKIDCALMRISGPVGQDEFEAQTLPRRLPGGLRWEPFVPIEILTFADGKINLDRVDGGDGGHGPAAWIGQGAYLKLSLPGDAVDGCNEAGKIDVDLGRFNGSLGCLNLSQGRCHRSLRRQIVLDGVVQILLAGGLLFGQRNVAVDVKFGPALHCLGVGKHGLGLRHLPFGLVERGLKRTRIDLKEYLPLPDECAFLVALPQKIARDLRPDVRIGESVERADPLAKNRNILLFNLHDLNVRRSARLRSRCVLWARRSNNQADDNQEKRAAYPEFVFRKCVHVRPRQRALTLKSIC